MFSENAKSLSPMVSVVVPIFNEDPRHLIECLDSLINQTHQDFECLLVDESTDPESTVCCDGVCRQDSRFLYIRPSARLGLAGSLNLAISKAKGEFIARFDSDDVCDPSRLERQVRFMEKNPSVGVLGSSMKIINEDGFVTGIRCYPESHDEIEKKFVFSNSIAHPTVMMRRSTLCAVGVGPYDEPFRYCEDLELWLRLLGSGVVFSNLPEELVSYRQTAATRSAKNWYFNIKARLRHLASPNFLLKCIVLALLAMWMCVPKVFQGGLYRRVVFSRKKTANR